MWCCNSTKKDMNHKIKATFFKTNHIQQLNFKKAVQLTKTTGTS